LFHEEKSSFIPTILKHVVGERADGVEVFAGVVHIGSFFAEAV
jgi:hypothetical protein